MKLIIHPKTACASTEFLLQIYFEPCNETYSKPTSSLQLPLHQLEIYVIFTLFTYSKLIL